MLKITSSRYDNESLIQSLIKKYPTLLPSVLSERIFTLVDEYPTDAGSIDVLCADEEGRIYIVETKLQKNSDRRTVIAQLLDYSAQMGKETFETFQNKIKDRTDKSLSEILEDFEESSEILERIKQGLVKKDFVLILAMDDIESRLKDMIIHLNQDWEMNIFGVELKRYCVDGKSEVFVPVIIPSPEPRPPIPPPPPDWARIVSLYKEKGLEAEILEIKSVFEKMKEQDAMVEIKFTPCYVVLDVGDKQIQVIINCDPKYDHGVWVYNPSLYDKVYGVGQKLGLKVKKGTSPNYLKVIQFNGVEGIRSIAGKMQNLIEDLLAIIKGA